MKLYGSLAELLQKARRRLIADVLLDRVVFAVAAGLAGVTVILLAGTDVLGWYWAVASALVALAAGLFLSRKRVPTIYQAAQKVDARLRLADTLSTAAYFLASPGDAEASIRESQRLQAESMAMQVDLKLALPYHRPRATYPALSLALAVAGVFVLRYAAQGSFDPKSSLVKSAYNTLFQPPLKQQAQAGETPGDPSQPADGEKSDDRKNSDFAGDPKFDPSIPNAGEDKKQSEQAKQDKEESGGQDKQDAKAGDASPSAQNQKQDSDKQEGNKNGNANQDPSMVDKIKQAVSDLLNKMKSQPQQNADNSKGQQDQSDQQPGQEGQQDNDAQGEGKESQAAQNADAKSEGNNGKSKPSQDQQSGVGSNDGEKAIKDAAALKAMGKISELIGKRSENVKGAMMVEVGQTKQTLTTPQLQRAAGTHAEAGSQIHRDEVPAIYQQYVQQYFEQVHKAIPAAKGAAPAAKK